MVFKQLLQAEAIDVCQIDSCRLAGVSEVLSVLLMSAKYVLFSSLPLDSCSQMRAHRFGIPVCPHAGGVGLCEYVIHLRYVLPPYLTPFIDLRSSSLSLIDYIAISGTMERNVLEFVDHLHEHFKTPCSINDNGRYNVPLDPLEGYSIEMYEKSIAEFEFPHGSYWVGAAKK